MIGYFTTLLTDYLTIIVVNLIFSIIVISLERRNPTAALAWLFFMTFVPGIGFIFFLLLSQTISKRKIFKYTNEEHELNQQFLESQYENISSRQFKFKKNKIKRHLDLILFHLKLSESYYSDNNNIKVFTNGNKLFNTYLSDIETATESVHVLFYIVKNDDLGRKLFDILMKKAEENVEVRLLVDYLGGRTITNKQVRHLKASGVKIAYFFPSFFKLFNTKANYRNHRKITIIDGEIGYVGGFNIGDEYLGKKKRFGNWRDTHLKIIGDSVVSLQLRFILDWRNASNEPIELSTSYIKELPPNDGNAGVQIVSSGPDSINEQIKQGFVKMIHSASKYVYIQSPYFIPDESIFEALKIAASSGVDVRIMIPSFPDHPFVYWATYSYGAELISYGVKLYTYTNGFLHAKTIVVDDEVCSCGTCNFDLRSFKLNFEVNAFIYDDEIAVQFKEIFLEDINNTREITEAIYKDRGFIIKIREALSRLFSPIL